MTAGRDASAIPGHFVKRAGDAAHAARLRREADLLAVADISGVVRLVALEGPWDDPVLVTARIDGSDLSREPELTVDEVAGVVVELAGTLADLHDLRIVHGAVMAEHVLLSSDGRPVLCGFGYGAPIGEPPVAEAPLRKPAVDPARAAGGPLSPASDVLALGALLVGLLDTAVPAPSSRADADALRAVAARTSVAAADLRPSARAVAEAVRHAAPSARPPGPSRLASADRTDPNAMIGDGARPAIDARQAGGAGPALQALRRGGGANHLPIGRHRRRPKMVVVGLALATLVLCALVLRASTGGAGRSRLQAEAPVPAPSSAPWPPDTTVATEPSSSVAPSPPTTGALPPGCPAVAGLLSADTDGDACPEALHWEAGVVQAGDRRWSVGQPGDVAITGDWTCAGVVTLAVLRPSTGQVFVFDGWATRGHDVSAPEAARLDGAFALRAAELDLDGCPDLVVERADLPPATVPLRVGRP